MHNLKTAGPGGAEVPRLDTGAPPTQFPYGKMKDDDPAGAGNGTQVSLVTSHDPLQAMYAILKSANITPNEALEDVVTSDVVTALKNMFMDIGDIKIRYGDLITGDNWLLCDGTTFSGVAYPGLSAFLGSTTLPDLRGEFLVGKLSGVVEFQNVGDSGGSKTVTLIANNLPEHTHPMTSGNIAGPEPLSDQGFIQGAANKSTEVNSTTNTPVDNLPPYRVVNYFIKAR